MAFKSRSPTSPLLYALMLAIGMITVYVFIEIASPRYLYTSDGLTYAEAAQNILAGKGIVATPFSPEPYNVDIEPLRLFPPGYPILIAAFATFGLKPLDLVVWLSVGSWILLFPAFTYALRPLLPPPAAAAFGYLAATSPGIVAYGYSAFSDVPFLLMIVISFAFLLRGLQNNNTWTIFASGFFASAAYSMRNTGAAYLLSVGVALLAGMSMNPHDWRMRARQLMTWTLGTIPIFVLLLARNYLTFGTIQPYSHPPGNTSAIATIRDYLRNMIFEALPNNTIAELAWDIKLLLVIGLPASALLLIGLRNRWFNLKNSGKTATLVMIIYLLLGSAIIVYAHVKWGAKGFDRYVLQYGWIIIALLSLAFNFKVAEKVSQKKYIIAIFTASTLLVLRMNYAFEYAHQPPNVRQILAKDTRLIQAVKKLPTNALIATNLIGFLPLETGRHVRYLEFKFNPNNGIESYLSGLRRNLDQTCNHVRGRPFYAVILPTRDVMREEYGTTWYETASQEIDEPSGKDPAWQVMFLKSLPQPLYVVKKTPAMILLGCRLSN